MVTELKPCPGCGKSGRAYTHSFDRSPDEYSVKCTVCGWGVELYETEEAAIEAWNTRHEPRELPEWFIHRLKNVIYGYSSCNGGYRDGYVKAIDWVLSLKKED